MEIAGIIVFWFGLGFLAYGFSKGGQAQAAQIDGWRYTWREEVGSWFFFLMGPVGFLVTLIAEILPKRPEFADKYRNWTFMLRIPSETKKQICDPSRPPWQSKWYSVSPENNSDVDNDPDEAEWRELRRRWLEAKRKKENKPK